MNDPEYLAHVADRAEELAGQLHAALTQVIVERIMIRLKRGVDYRLTASDKWMLEVLQDAGYLREDLMKELSARTGVILKEMSAAFEDAAVEAVRWDDAVYKAAGLDPTPLRQSPHLMRLVQRDYQKTAGEWRNFTGTLADASQEKFIAECDKAYHLVASHAMSYTQAIRQAVEAVAEDGVRVTYPSGHVDTIETATARAVRTGVGQACGDITLARMKEMGWDIALVSAHLGARTGDGGENFTNHYWLQGKFYSVSGTDERFPPLSVCGIGDVRGLLGANCRHSIGPGDGEFNPFQHFDSEANRKQEKLDQRQRALERRIRATRREVMGLQAGGELTDEKYRRKAQLLQRQEAEYDAFCEDNDLKKLSDRLAVARYGPDQAHAAERAAKAGAAQTGAQSGAKKTPGWQDRHAERYYEEVRKRKPYSDAKKIAANVDDFSIQEIEDIRQHLFLKEQPRDGRMARFDASYEQAEVWQRLIDGRRIRPSDKVFLQHELCELTIMREKGYNYEKAHEIANAKFDWWKAYSEEV